jgi:hypothetical protein
MADNGSNIHMRTPEGGKSSITCTRNGDAVDLVFIRPGIPSVGIRITRAMARNLADSLKREADRD